MIFAVSVMIPDFDKTKEQDQVVLWAKRLAYEGFVVVDTETIGFIPPDICQIGIVYVRRGIETIDILMDQLIKPSSQEWEQKAIEIHGITPDKVKDAPTILGAWIDVLKCTSLSENLICFNRQFDGQAIRYSLGQHGIKADCIANNVWPTGASMKCAMLAYSQYVGEKRKPTDKNCKWQKLPDYGYGAHTAVGDAQSTARLVLELAKK